MEKKRNNPELYDELAKHQYEESDAASSAFANFAEEVYQLRKDYKILELCIVAQVRVKHGDKGVAQVMSAHFGSDGADVALLAYALKSALDQPRKQVVDFLTDKDAGEA